MTRQEIQELIDNIETGIPNTAVSVRTVLSAIADGTAITGDIKQIDVSNAYMIANFDVTGLGINERLGWAICNGNNGTRNRNGRVSLQFDPINYPTLGATGGSKDAVVVEHQHVAGSYNLGSGTPIFTGKGLESGFDNVYGSTNFVGESGVNKNLQPYIVTLFIQKI